MCISAAIIASGLIGGAVTKHQGDKQRELMEKQAEESRRLQRQQQAAFDLKQQKAEAAPTLLRNATQKTRPKGMQGLKVKKASSYGSMGVGSMGVGGTGVGGTGLNIPKG
jgi:histone acetyltransferase (RNA polymerase elongator complex component)